MYRTKTFSPGAGGRLTASLANLVCLIAALLALPVSADEAPATGMIWQVAGVRNTMYLVGSVHMLRESDFPLAPSIEDAYREAESLVMELDMDDLNPLVVQTVFFTRGRLGGEHTLESLLGPENWQSAHAAAAELGIDLGMLNKVKPWWAAITIVQLQLGKLGFDPALGLESYFAQRAARDKKPIQGLETVAEQVKLFDDMKMDHQIRMLLKSLEDAAELEQQMERLLSAWRGGHAGKMAEMQDESFSDFQDLYASLIRDRNDRWVRELEALLDDDQDYLVVVGALHLAGKDSVVAALERMGYSVTRR